MTGLGGQEWRLIREEARPGPMQMALDEVAAETAAAGGPRTLRVYRWEPGTLSLGYSQDPATIDWTFCEREGITVTRRQTGGGAIYHDSYGDISYSIVAPAAELPGDLLESYRLLCTPLFDAFERMGVDAAFAERERPAVYEPSCYLRALHPAHDVVAGGKKLSGNAQYRQRDSVVQHGSVTYACETERHLGTFADPPDPDAFRERVTSVREQAGIDRERAVECLETALKEWADAESGAWTDGELARARRVAERKYASEDWTCGEAPRASETASGE
jgi:lipoate-protein ligase A